MNSLLFKIIFTLFSLLACQSFAQPGPTLVINARMIPFDPSYVGAANAKVVAGTLHYASLPVDQALASGITHIGSLNLIEFKKQMPSVKLYVLAEGVSALGAGRFAPRLGAVYWTDTKSIYLNSESMVQNPSAVLRLLVHEYLGALGYEDENYQISSLLISKNLKSTLIHLQSVGYEPVQRLKTSPQQYFKYLAERGGGATVIGGGGDEILYEAKAFILDQFDLWKNKVLPGLLDSEPGRLAQKKLGFDVRSKITPRLLDEYFAYYVKMPFESMSDAQSPPKGPITDPNDMDKICGAFDNAQSSAYLRLSRDHWDMAIGQYSVEQSRVLLAMQAHTVLFYAYLELRFGKKK